MKLWSKTQMAAGSGLVQHRTLLLQHILPLHRLEGALTKDVLRRERLGAAAHRAGYDQRARNKLAMHVVYLLSCQDNPGKAGEEEFNSMPANVQAQQWPTGQW